MFYIPQESEHLFHHLVSCPPERWTGATGKVAPSAGQHLGEYLGKINQDHC